MTAKPLPASQLVSFVIPMALCVLASGCALAHGRGSVADPALGTWDLDVRRSSFQPGPPVRSQTRTYTDTPAGVRFVLEGISASGAPVRNEYTAPYDGRDYPLLGVPRTNSVALRRVSRWEVDAIEKKDGVAIYQVKRLVSEDGRTMTITVQGTGADGRAVSNVLVFHRR